MYSMNTVFSIQYSILFFQSIQYSVFNTFFPEYSVFSIQYFLKVFMPISALHFPGFALPCWHKHLAHRQHVLFLQNSPVARQQCQIGVLWRQIGVFGIVGRCWHWRCLFLALRPNFGVFASKIGIFGVVGKKFGVMDIILALILSYYIWHMTVGVKK